MLFLCVNDQYKQWGKGFLEGSSYQGHYVGGVGGEMINLICPERGVITTYGPAVRASMVEDPENEEKH